jgi:hypothetical protein
MDRLTDHPNWQEAVFDDAIVATWRTEALGQPEDAIYQEIVGEKRIPMPKRTRIMTEAAFNYVGCRLMVLIDGPWTDTIPSALPS